MEEMSEARVGERARCFHAVYRCTAFWEFTCSSSWKLRIQASWVLGKLHCIGIIEEIIDHWQLNQPPSSSSAIAVGELFGG